MHRIDKNDMKLLELNILKNVANFCDEHNIKYYICGGTLIGAVRHRGFIPWDDDVDIAMNRSDYNRFVNEYNKYSCRYKVNCIENNSNWHMSFARVEDYRTTLYEETLIDKYKECHVFIDVFPIDGIPNNAISEKIFLLKQKILGIMLNASSFKFFPSKHYSDSKENNIGLKNFIRTIFKYIAIIIFKPLKTQYLAKMINKNSSKYSCDSSSEVGLTVFVWNWKFEKASREAFSERKKFTFENLEFYGPVGYDEYLTKTYGDYMTPPPIENQVSHHSFEAYIND